MKDAFAVPELMAFLGFYSEDTLLHPHTWHSLPPSPYPLYSVFLTSTYYYPIVQTLHVFIFLWSTPAPKKVISTRMEALAILISSISITYNMLGT